MDPLKNGTSPPPSRTMRCIRVMSPLDSLIATTFGIVSTRSTRNSGGRSMPLVAGLL
nr:hypothetical protein [Saccharopolyspora sp. 6V]